MIFELYRGLNKLREEHLTVEEIKLGEAFRSWLLPFPVHRLHIRTGYSLGSDNVRVEIELDSIISCEIIYNKVAHRIFKVLQLDLISLQNRGNPANFSYCFYGEKTVLGYDCSILVDIPKEPYISKPGNFNKH